LSNRERVVFRASGNEPLIRCHIEAKSRANMKKLQTACREVLA
jgi:phosphomannomutase